MPVTEIGSGCPNLQASEDGGEGGSKKAIDRWECGPSPYGIQAMCTAAKTGSPRLQKSTSPEEPGEVQKQCREKKASATLVGHPSRSFSSHMIQRSSTFISSEKECVSWHSSSARRNNRMIGNLPSRVTGTTIWAMQTGCYGV